MRNVFMTIGFGVVATCTLAIFSQGCAAQAGAAGALQSTRQATSGIVPNQATGTDALSDPSKATLQAPAEFKAKFETTKGDFVIVVRRAWAPNGADRFYNMVKAGFFKDIAIFRAIRGFMFQFGIHGTPSIAQAWGNSTIKDDPFVGNSNTVGKISFAQTGRPNSRSSQMFINLGDNSGLDRQDTPFVPFGEVISGMEVVKAINTQYGENRPQVQMMFRQQGNAFIRKEFPNLDFITKVTVIE